MTDPPKLMVWEDVQDANLEKRVSMMRASLPEPSRPTPFLDSADSEGVTVFLRTRVPTLILHHREGDIGVDRVAPRICYSPCGAIVPPASLDRTPDVHRSKCQAHFLAWYGTEENAEIETIDVEKCGGLCGGDSFKRGVQGHVIRLMARVAREPESG